MKLLSHTRIALSLVVLTAALAACKTEQRQQNSTIFDKKSMPSAAYYVHCDTCRWCKGPYKKTQDAERISRDHNIQKHEYIKFAYYDEIKCKH